MILVVSNNNVLPSWVQICIVPANLWDLVKSAGGNFLHQTRIGGENFFYFDFTEGN